MIGVVKLSFLFPSSLLFASLRKVNGLNQSLLALQFILFFGGGIKHTIILTSFMSITMLCGTGNIPQNIPTYFSHSSQDGQETLMSLELVWNKSL